MKRIILSVSISLCCLFSSVVRGAAQEEPEPSAADKTENPSGAVISANIGFADDATLYTLSVAYELRTSSIVGVGGGMDFGVASPDHESRNGPKAIGVFNPFARVRVNMLQDYTTPFFIFDAGFIVSEKDIDSRYPDYTHGVMKRMRSSSISNGVSLSPALGIDIKAGKGTKIRVSGGLKYVIGTGKFDGRNEDTWFVSLGCKF